MTQDDWRIVGVAVLLLLMLFVAFTYLGTQEGMCIDAGYPYRVTVRFRIYCVRPMEDGTLEGVRLLVIQQGLRLEVGR